MSTEPTPAMLRFTALLTDEIARKLQIALDNLTLADVVTSAEGVPDEAAQHIWKQGAQAMIDALVIMGMERP